jgi:DNA-binding MarR family transcriptional regulator
MSSRTSAGDAATRVILSAFRANGSLLAAGDRLAAAEGLTAARWQVLGAIALGRRPLTVPQIARRMGLTRQSVHGTVDRLARDGLIELVPNADHQRSRLVRLTEPGERCYAALSERQVEWVSRLSDGLEPAELQTAARILDTLSTRLQGEDHYEVVRAD